jgi:hypothetical protein
VTSGARTARPVDWAAFPCALGDVVLRAGDGKEVWLAGALVLREDAPAAVLFVAPDASVAGGERAVYVRPRPVTDILWLAPVARESLGVGPEPPTAIELDGVHFQRARRLPLRAERVGEGAPDVGATVVLGEYASDRGDVALVLVGERAMAWRGVRLAEGDYDVWRPESSDSRR